MTLSWLGLYNQRAYWLQQALPPYTQTCLKRSVVLNLARLKKLSRGNPHWSAALQSSLTFLPGFRSWVSRGCPTLGERESFPGWWWWVLGRLVIGNTVLLCAEQTQQFSGYFLCQKPETRGSGGSQGPGPSTSLQAWAPQDRKSIPLSQGDLPSGKALHPY